MELSDLTAIMLTEGGVTIFTSTPSGNYQFRATGMENAGSGGNARLIWTLVNRE